MKIVFAGPSIHGVTLEYSDIIFRPPASLGDIATAVLGGATVIGLIDGMFESTAAVWHKEILYALSMQVSVLGAASMGALRAAECAAFGMEPIGEIANRYLTGELDDDAAVAISHGPAEFGYAPFTEALVDAEATIEHLLEKSLISAFEAKTLSHAATSIFFKERTPRTILAQAYQSDPARQSEVLSLYRQNKVLVKQKDALDLLQAVSEKPAHGRVILPSWQLAQTPTWQQVFKEFERDNSQPNDWNSTSGVTHLSRTISQNYDRDAQQ